MNKKWYKLRHYLHFDAPISQAKAQYLVFNKEKVAKHSFYPFITYKEITTKIKKKEGKIEEAPPKCREIAYAAHYDSHIYSYYSRLLGEKYEELIQSYELDENILAFRCLGKSNIHFAYKAFTKIAEYGDCTAISLDFSNFFGTLDHQILKKSWANLLKKESSTLPSDHFNIYKSLTKYASVDKDVLYKLFSISSRNLKEGKLICPFRICTPKEFRMLVRGNKLITINKYKYGIPQGSPISAVLSNIYMIDFDLEMKKAVELLKGQYYRYCDDVLFIIPTNQLDSLYTKINKNIKNNKLIINKKKTEIITFKSLGGKLKSDKPLQYLGFIFTGEEIYLRSSSLSRYSRKMKSGVRLAIKTKKKYNAIRRHKGQPIEKLYKKKLYKNYTYVGNRNFISYAHRAAKIMGSKGIKRQIKPLFKRFLHEIGEE